MAQKDGFIVFPRAKSIVVCGDIHRRCDVSHA